MDQQWGLWYFVMGGQQPYLWELADSCFYVLPVSNSIRVNGILEDARRGNGGEIWDREPAVRRKRNLSRSFPSSWS